MIKIIIINSNEFKTKIIIMEIKKSKILIIDDSEAILFLLRRVLSSQFDVQTIDNANKALDIIDESYDTIIVDLMMPEMNGIEFIKIFRTKKIFDHIPIIILTAKQNTEDDIANLFEMGANDYIMKPFFSAELIARVKTHSKIKLLTERLIDANRKLVFSATHDDLTKVYNRNAIFDFLENDLLRIKRTKSYLSVLMFDIDYFKEINDTYGHLAGDEVLVFIIQIIKDVVREIDLIGRYGGDEFIIIFPNTKIKKSEEIANRILKKINSKNLKIHNNNINISISIGISEYVKGESIDCFIERIDNALYDAKKSGRNCVRIR